MVARVSLMLCFALTALCAASALGEAIRPTVREMELTRQWAAAKFDGVHASIDMKPGLCVVANKGPVQMNARYGQPMNIAGVEYTNGLYCHAVSRLVVTLPKPGRTFTSAIGIDREAYGGSAVFSVEINGIEEFSSEVLHCGDKAVPISVGLRGSRTFTLCVGDAGDGIYLDQVDWADAKVVLEDGSELWLSELPMVDSQPVAPSVALPFSFVYDGKPSSEFIDTWNRTTSSKKMDANRTMRTLIYTDPKTKLEVKCVSVEYADFPVVEWTVYLRNTGSNDTPIISSIKGIDADFEQLTQSSYVIHTIRGDDCSVDSYQPLHFQLERGAAKNITAVGGRPTQVVWPYFNIEFVGQGVIVAIGWPGQWSADFVRDQSIALRCSAGQELTHLALRPGEEVRSPLIALLFWEGDHLRSQNIWRRWMLAHNLPECKPMLASCSGGFFPGLKVNRDSEIQWIDEFTTEKVPLDYWWMDAGWYYCNIDWGYTGTWEYDKDRFPNGIREVSDHARSKGLRQILWFEPERVRANTMLADEHPEWILGDGFDRLLNIGIPECRAWLTEHIDSFIKSQGIDLYRQDFNIDPLAHWRANDTPDRQGITENNYVCSYLAYWDELLKRNPGLRIDSCASGGRRNDLETMRRAVPLLRSDYQTRGGDLGLTAGNQGHTYGLSFWMPYQGHGAYWHAKNYIYAVRSYLTTALGLCADARNADVDWGQIRKAASDFRAVSEFLMCDYYPLTSYSIDEANWIAWQFDRPETGEGIVQVFRRRDSVYRSADLRMRALDADAHYAVTDIDTKQSTQYKGRELMESGLPITLTERPCAAILIYKRL